MATNHDETLQERYARELAAMEPKTPMVKVMASNWQEDSLAPTWQQLHKAQTEYDELRAELQAARQEVVEQAKLNGMGAEREARLMAEVSELKAKLTEKASLLRGCYAADHKQKQRIEELTAELERIKALPPVAWRSSMGHGVTLKEAITDDQRALTWDGKPMWQPLYALGSKHD